MLRLRLVRNFTSKAGRISSAATTKAFRNQRKPKSLKKAEGDGADIGNGKVSLLEHLKERGLINQVTEDSLQDLLQNKFTSFYLGIDPSGPSMHLGHMVPVMIMLHLFVRGHHAFSLVGGATGAVGDPTGKKKERNKMAKTKLETNLDQLAGSLERTFLHAVSAAKKEGLYYGDQVKLQYAIVNNHDWWKNMSFLEFLGEYGRLIRVNQMIARDSVKDRLSSSTGIGYNEFSYQILQAFDFWHLYETQGCRLQLGGGDQWGNITAGVDLAKRAAYERGIDETPYGVTTKLMLSSNGKKLGKSENNATIWLDPTMTPPFELYQHMLKVADIEVETYLKMFTFMSLSDIKEVMEKHVGNEHRRYAQRILADKFTALIHGDTVIEQCQIITRIMFARSHLELNMQPKHDAMTDAAALKRILSEAGLLHTLDHRKEYGVIVAEAFNLSKTAAGKLIKQNGVTVGMYAHKKIGRGPILERDKDLQAFLIIRTGHRFKAYYLGDAEIEKPRLVVGISDSESYKIETGDIDVTRKSSVETVNVTEDVILEGEAEVKTEVKTEVVDETQKSDSESYEAETKLADSEVETEKLEPIKTDHLRCP